MGANTAQPHQPVAPGLPRPGSAVVIGIGNPILSDDGIGWRVAEQVEAALRAHGDSLVAGRVDVRRMCLGGLALAEMLVGYEGAVVIDAILTGSAGPGTVHRFGISDLPATLNTASSHDLTLAGALATLRRLGAPLPPDDRIRVIAIEAEDVWTFGETCTPRVARSMARAVQAVLDELAARPAGQTAGADP